MGLQSIYLHWRCSALVAYALFGTIIIQAIIMNIIIILLRIIIVIIIMIIIKVSAVLVLMRGGSRVSTVSIFYWLYCFKVAVEVKDIVFDKLTILFLFNY